MASTLAQGAITSITSQMGLGTAPKQESSPIKWEEYNFPPCLRLIHFKLSELQGLVKKVVYLLYIELWLIVAILLANCMHIIGSPLIYYSRRSKGYRQQHN